MPAEDTRAVADIRAVRDRWIVLDSEVRQIAGTDHEKALALSKLHAKDPVNLEKTIGSLVKRSEERLGKQVAETKIIHATANRNLTAVALGAFAIALGFGLFIYLGIRRNVKALLSMNTNLENLVSERTFALARRERSLRLILDSTGDAFIEIDRNGRLTGDTSAETVRWFGQYKPDFPSSQYLLKGKPDEQKSFEVAYSQLTDDILLWELTAEQMPKRIEVRDAILELEYRRVVEDGELTKVLVVARDVTAQVHSEAAERNAREQQAVLGKLLSDKAGFVQFVASCEELITSLSNTTDPQLTKRNLHTLKGNTAVYGMASVAEYCHLLEDSLAASGEPLPSGKVANHGTLWRSKMRSVQEFLSGIGDNILEIDSEEHQRLIDSLMGRRDYQEILAMVEMWSWCRTSERLVRLRAQTEYIAKRLDKDVLVVVDHHDIRIPNDYLHRFWPVLIHVVRNAVDHGIEARNDRALGGKSTQASVTLATYESNDELVIEISDDGRGIDAGRALAAAKKRGVALPEEASLVDIITAEGVSTNEVATDLSGRGIGLSAVRHACELDGGTLNVVNHPGMGATFQFKFRKPIVKTGALAAKLAKRWSLVPLKRAAG